MLPRSSGFSGRSYNNARLRASELRQLRRSVVPLLEDIIEVGQLAGVSAVPLFYSIAADKGIKTYEYVRGVYREFVGTDPQSGKRSVITYPVSKSNIQKTSDKKQKLISHYPKVPEPVKAPVYPKSKMTMSGIVSSSLGKRKYYGDGKFIGSIRARKFHKRSKLKVSYVVQNARELRGTASDNDGMFIGVGPDLNEVFQAWVKCCVHLLFKEAGVAIENWSQEPTGDAYTIVWEFFDNFTSTSVSSFSMVATAGDSYATIATKLASSINTNISNERFHRFSTMRLAGGGSSILSKIDMDKVKYKVFVSNNMLVQNRTLSGLTTSTEEVKTSSETIANNPIYCRFYNCKGNALFFKHTSGQQTLFTWTNPVIDYELSSMTEVDRHIDNSTFLNAKVSKTCILDPGQIKNIKSSWSQTLSTRSIYNLLEEFINNGSSNSSYTRKRFGKVAVLGIDKMLRADATENPIDIAYELNTKLSMGYRYYNKIVPPSTFTQS